MNIGLSGLVVLSLVIIPSMIFFFFLTHMKIVLNVPSAAVYLFRALPFLTLFGVLGPFFISFWWFTTASPVDPVRILISQVVTVDSESIVRWSVDIFRYYLVCVSWSLIVSALLKFLLNKAVVTGRSEAKGKWGSVPIQALGKCLASVLESFRIWDSSLALLMVYKGTLDVSLDGHGETVFSGTMDSVASIGPMPGIVMKNIRKMRRYKSSESEKYETVYSYRDDALGTMLFPFSSISQIHFSHTREREAPKGVGSILEKGFRNQ
jgi:hypothetical protein